MKSPSLPTILLLQDGDRRWAKERGLPVEAGYQEMGRKLAFVYENLYERGFRKLYVPLCSRKNLERPKNQIDSFYLEFLNSFSYTECKVRVELSGNLELIPPHLKEVCFELAESTKSNRDFTVVCLLNWAVDDEIVRIYNKLHDQYPIIDTEILQQHSDIKEPIDMIIRTGKRTRLSAFIPINSPYAEIYFMDILFPDIEKKDIDAALEFYSSRQRTYGL